MDDPHYDLIIVGTGFASTFFLRQYLGSAKADARVLVVEKGQRRPHSWVLQNRRHSRKTEDEYVRNLTPKKEWRFSVMFGGGSNCWFGCTPRFMPDDFEMRSKYGVGMDWPLTYDDLEPFYCDAEELMVISGPEHSPFRRSRPYPQGPHRFSKADEALAEAWPNDYYHLPAARPVKATPSGRPGCCNNGVCSACPIESKFTILRDFGSLYDDARVTVLHGQAVERVTFRADVATGIEYGDGKRARGDFIALGANAIFNPFILLASGLEHPALGRYLNEQRGAMVTFDTKGITDFQGSTVQTGHGYMFYSGEHRKKHSAFLLEHSNAPSLRLEPGRWRERMRLKFIIEDLPRKENYVRFNPARPDKPEIHFEGYSDYSERALKEVPRFAEKLVEKLPIEHISEPHGANWTESHIQGTARMGDDPETSVVDRHSLHHTYRNLAVLGGSSFPTSSPANPTLTISALALLSGQHSFGKAP